MSEALLNYPEYVELQKGGKGSGHHGHTGRPGQVGGSMADEIDQTSSLIRQHGKLPDTDNIRIHHGRDADGVRLSRGPLAMPDEGWVYGGAHQADKYQRWLREQYKAKGSAYRELFRLARQLVRDGRLDLVSSKVQGEVVKDAIHAILKKVLMGMK